MQQIAARFDGFDDGLHLAARLRGLPTDAVAYDGVAALAAGLGLQPLSLGRFHNEVAAIGRHDQAFGHCKASTCAAQIRSLSVRPPAEWVLHCRRQRL